MGKSMIVTRFMHVLILLLVFVMGTVAQAELSDGLQAYWQFEGNGNDSQGTVNLTEFNNGSTIVYSEDGVDGQAVLVPHDTGGGASFMGTVGAAGTIYNTTGKYITIS